MRRGILVFALGIVMGLQVPVLPTLLALLSASTLLLVTATLIWRRYPCCLLFLSGLMFCLLRLLWQESRLPAPGQREDVLLRGQVAALPQRAGPQTRFLFDSQQRCLRLRERHCDAEEAWEPYRRRLQLSDYRGGDWTTGSHWQLQARLQRPRGLANPGIRDQTAWYWEQGIAARGYVRQHPDQRLLRSAHGVSGQWGQLRASLQAWLEAQDLRQGPLLMALALGERQAIDDAQWAVLAATGTSHLMVISGLHIALVAGGVFLLTRVLWALLPGACLWRPAQSIAPLAALLAAGAYAGLAGFTLPTQRAFLMCACAMLGLLCLRQTRARNSLLLALLVILLWQPLSPLSTGFWLSFGAVALILGHRRTTEQRPRRLLTALSLQARLSLGMLPMMLVFFQQWSLLSPLTNLLAIPWTGIIIVPALLGGILLAPWPGLSRPLLQWADSGLALLMGALSFVATQGDWLWLDLPALPVSGQLWLVLGLLLFFLAPLRWWWRALGLSGLLAFLFPLTQPLSPGALRLHLLDVGQAQAVILESAEQVILYDAGPAFSGRGVLPAYWRAHNIAPPQLIIISHGDSDHAGGLQDILALFPDTPVISAEPERLSPEAEPTPCESGTRWESAGLTFTILHPPAESALQRNERSCVLQVKGLHWQVLLTGDIEQRAEARLVAHYGEELRSSVLLAPHHGSRSSSTAAFVQQVDPELVLISHGHLNRYGHPAPEVLARYLSRGSRVLSTAEEGRIRVDILPDGQISTSSYRREYRRVWH